jgi:low affinity Fe/Cu permease
MNFDKLAQAVARSAGRPLTFIIAVTLVIVWGVSGPIFGFSDTWQLIINTSTTIVTFLMVFLIQNTQNRDTDALQVKIDELLRVTEGARLALLNLEEMKTDDLDRIKQGFVELGRRNKGEADDPSRSSTAGS